MDHSRRNWLKHCALAGCALCPALAQSTSSNKKYGVHRITGRAFGTHWSLTVPTETATLSVLPTISGILDTVDGQFSPYRTDSSISIFNQPTRSHWRNFIRRDSDVIATSLKLAKLSDGAFDPTIGPLVNRFGFGPIIGAMQPNYKALEWDGETLIKLNPTLTLDLCAVAKGYAIDLIVDQLNVLGIDNFLIDCGGELRASGCHPTGRPWKVAIEQPDLNVGKLYSVVNLENQALATSGLYRNAFEYKGQRYHHLIDSRSHKPVFQNLMSVSVLSKRAMDADGWATTLLLLGPERGPALARQQQINALFILSDEHGFRDITTGQFSHDRVKNL